MGHSIPVRVILEELGAGSLKPTERKAAILRAEEINRSAKQTAANAHLNRVKGTYPNG